MSRTSERFPYIDFLKAGAAQLIILHHLAFYGPMSDHVAEMLPGVIRWLSEYGRMAVQVFLVVGGFLAARSLAPLGTGRPFDLPAMLRRRYLKLALPYFAALALAIAGATLARALMTHHSIPAAPTVAQVLAHVLLLQDVLGIEALSAGVWYVAVDFQLFALLALIVWLTGRAEARLRGAARVLPAVVLLLVCASVVHFNRHAAWDAWAPYFAGAYGAGALAYWSGVRAGGSRYSLRGVALVAALAAAFGLALTMDFRGRLLLALVAALFLALARRSRVLQAWQPPRTLTLLSESSYAIFLVHFPVCLLVNAIFALGGVRDAWLNAAGMLLAWACSVAAGVAFHRLVESPRPAPEPSDLAPATVRI